MTSLPSEIERRIELVEAQMEALKDQVERVDDTTQKTLELLSGKATGDPEAKMKASLIYRVVQVEKTAETSKKILIAILLAVLVKIGVDVAMQVWSHIDGPGQSLGVIQSEPGGSMHGPARPTPVAQRPWP